MGCGFDHHHVPAHRREHADHQARLRPRCGDCGHTQPSVDSVLDSWNADTDSCMVLPADEIIDSVYGFAGSYPYYKNSLLITIGFTIFNTKTGTSRIEGVSFIISFLRVRDTPNCYLQPFGGNNGTADGQVFHVSSPIALAGFETTGGQSKYYLPSLMALLTDEL